MRHLKKMVTEETKIIFQVLRTEDPYTHAHGPETATQLRGDRKRFVERLLHGLSGRCRSTPHRTMFFCAFHALRIDTHFCFISASF